MGLLGLLALAAMGCSRGYQDQVEQMHRAINAGNVPLALQSVNEALGVDYAHQLPPSLEGDVPLLLLERGMLLQAQGMHEDAVRDFNTADQVLEVLDLTEDTAADIGKYLISDDVTLYKAPPHEKLLVNVMAMISYLAMGDVEGAKVEARRLNVLQRYYKSAAEGERSFFSLGSYLAGFTFEVAGDQDAALRYYLEAWKRQPRPSLQGPIQTLSAATGYRSAEVEEALEGAPPDVGRPLGDDEGLLLVVVQNGRAPFKIARRHPVGLFFSLAVADASSGLSPDDRAAADKAIVSGLLKWISFPVLVEVDSAYSNFSLRVDGDFYGQPQYAIDVRQGTLQAWRRDKDKLMIAAFTRMLTRAVAAEATTAIGKGSGLDKQLFPGASWLLGRAVEGIAAANDTADTRSWTTLPSNVQVYRVVVPAGRHTLQVNAFGDGFAPDQRVVEVPPRGFAAATFRYLRGSPLPPPEIEGADELDTPRSAEDAEDDFIQSGYDEPGVKRLE